MQATAGSATGKLQTELLARVLSAAVKILTKQGKIVPFKIDGKEVTIKFTSPMARQQDADEIMQVMRTMEMMRELPDNVVDEEVAVEKVPHFLVDKMGLPKIFKRTDAEKQQRREQQQKMMQAQMEAQGGGLQ